MGPLYRVEPKCWCTQYNPDDITEIQKCANESGIKHHNPNSVCQLYCSISTAGSKKNIIDLFM